MADYQGPDARGYRPNPHQAPRPDGYSNGYAPQHAVRSQTLPDYGGRAPSLTSGYHDSYPEHYLDDYQDQPPRRPSGGRPPQNQYGGGFVEDTNGYAPPRNESIPQSQSMGHQQYHQPRAASHSNAYGTNQQYHEPHQIPQQPPQAQPYQQYPPQAQGYHDRRAHQPQAHPPRMESRVSPASQFPPRPAPGPGTGPGRGGYPPPAVNGDPYRTRSLASSTSPPAGYNNGPPRNGYHGPGQQRAPSHPGMSRTTAQGRVVPERQDERAMSLSTYAEHPQVSSTTMSGRIIPHRRRDSGGQSYDPAAHINSQRFNTPSPMSAAQQARTASLQSISSVGTGTTVVSSSQQRADSLQHKSSTRSGGSMTSSTSTLPVTASRKAPLVYPALLSRVADAFRDRILLGDRLKNELTYSNAFLGQEAVDLIAYIIKTTDRNLALLLGRALDAQKFFHDVTYDHRLRDSTQEVYQFRETLVEGESEVNGVFTLLTECYSPTCTPEKLCYSIACPRRLEQQARLNMKLQPGLRRQDSRSSLHNDNDDQQKLWINTVSKEVADSVSEKEKKRQEVICEIMYTERDFVKDLEYLRDFWMKPLRSTNSVNPSPVPEIRRERFIKTVFSNVLEVLAVNSRMADSLTKRQKSAVVYNIGDIFLEYVPMFDPFIIYGSTQLYGKYEYEKERASNPAFSKFVDETERLKESRKLELNGYLTKPTTRLARYPLLLEQVLKFTDDQNPDKEHLPKAIALIREFLTKVNQESGKAENNFTIMQLNEALRFQPGEFVDLRLTEEGRQLIYKGSLKKSATDTGDILVYLFDHCLLLVRVKTVNKKEEHKVFRKPIPLELLVVPQMDEVIPRAGIVKRTSSNLIPAVKTDPNIRAFPITFKHIGKQGFDQTLFATTPVQRKKWLEHIESQQNTLLQRNNLYTKTIVCENFFSGGNRVNCLVPIDGGRKFVYGTDTGVFVSDKREEVAKPKRVLDLAGVTHLGVLEEYSLLLVLANKTLSSFSMEVLFPTDNQSPLVKRPKKIMGHINFFKTGLGMGRHLVCAVKSSTLTSTVRVLEPVEAMSKGKKKSALNIFQTNQDTLKPFQEFYVPSESSSVHFLKATICVGCGRGFELISLETGETQSLLNAGDTSLDFAQRRENVVPVHIERMNGEFLLNYSDFSFFINRSGWRAKPGWKITWVGRPNAFALCYPFILAFEPSFIEIRNLQSTQLEHIITGKNIRMLHSSTNEILYAYEDESGGDIVASLDFWTKNR